MSYQEKKTIVSIIIGALVLAAYTFYVVGQYQSGAVAPGDLNFWAKTILIFIGIGVVASIIIQILFHILLSISIAIQKKIQNEACDDQEIEKSIGAEIIEDEMDKLIELKSMRVGFFLAGIGFIAALVSLVLNYSPVVMLNIMFGSFWMGSLLEGFTQLYFYRKGLSHG
jgi:hypothetical protein